ncbi:helix-hairpin-helix domain-containing protein [Comamonas sp. MYb396]|uniref:helix-hairpin-helix domain-containing protein n=1 Tax=Comamonas sp. MYb396 TaxID=2745302 RepID=UPI00309E8B05
MNTSTAHPSFHAATTLQGLLPPHLWRVLARNGITTIEQVAQSYPEKLLQMPSVGPRTFRKIEESLFPGKRYAPPRQAYVVQTDLDQPSKALPFFRRTQNALRRHDLK